MRNKKKLCKIIAIATAITAAITGAVFFIKRHRRKGRYAAFALTAVLLYGVMGAVMTVYANEPDTDLPTAQITQAAEPDEDNIIHVETEATQTITGEDLQIDIGDFLSHDRQPNQLTPPGNMTLVDDFHGESAEDKQFITVTTRNGHFFYIIIDRAGERNNVHFLNQVSEVDLLLIFAELEENGVNIAPLPPIITTNLPTPGNEPADTDPPEYSDNPEPEPTQQRSNTGLLLMVIVIAAVGGGAYYYFRIYKPKQGTTPKATTPKHDEFEFDPDDELFSDNESENSDFDYSDDTDDMPDFTATESEDE